MPASDKKNKGNTEQARRRKRVNRMKSIIVFLAIVLLFASVILNIILAVKVWSLESRIDDLYSEVHIETVQTLT